MKRLFSFDDYASRMPKQCGMQKRLDPVIYQNYSRGAPISEVQLEFYAKNGFLVLENVFTESEVHELSGAAIKLKKTAMNNTFVECFREKQSKEIRSIFNIHALDAHFNNLVRHERLLSIARFILNDEVYIHQSRLNFKPAFYGKEFYWHSDFETWHMEDGMPRMRALSMSITLTHNVEQNGPLLLIPGSHKTYVACAGKTPNNHYQQSLIQQQYGIPDSAALMALLGDRSIVSAVSPMGSVIIFDCNTMHGSNGNITPYPRTNAFFVYNAWSNRLQAPYCGLPPRPEFIAARENVSPLYGD